MTKASSETVIQFVVAWSIFPSLATISRESSIGEMVEYMARPGGP